MPNGCRVYRTTNLSVPSGVQTAVPFDAERWDDASYHDPVTNPTRITINEAGRYHVFYSVAMNRATYAFAQSFIRVNGSVALAMDKREIDPGNSSWSPSTVWQFNAGDYVELVVWCNYPVTVLAAPSYSVEAGVEKIS